jgi:Zn-dependent protease
MDMMILRVVEVLVPMILSLSVHEYAHARTAKGLGDDTAESMGRLNLNPLSHVDPVGSIFLPALLIVSGSGFFFGWAKPVPVNPTRFNPGVGVRRAMMWVALAGPLSNLALAVLAQGLIAAMLYMGLEGASASFDLLSHFLMINVALALFNILPVYPLDGHKVLSGLLPGAAALRYETWSARYGSSVLFFIVLFGGRLISEPMHWLLLALRMLFGLGY